MLVRSTALCALAALALALSASPSEACGRRAPRACACYPIHPCPPASCCSVYSVSEPVEKLGGPYHPILRTAKLCHGVIVQVDWPSGTNPAPCDEFCVSVTGPGHLKYEGWNKKELSPGTPGGTVRYSFFLCPTQCGKARVDVTFKMSSGSPITVPFLFDVCG